MNVTPTTEILIVALRYLTLSYKKIDEGVNDLYKNGGVEDTFPDVEKKYNEMRELLLDIIKYSIDANTYNTDFSAL